MDTTWPDNGGSAAPELGGLSPVLQNAPQLRAFDDVETTRNNIFSGVMDSVSKRYPLENSRYRLELSGLKYHTDKPYTLAQQKKALLAGKTLSRRLQGTWRLVDKATMKPVDEKQAVVAHVPYLTERGTFIYRGNEYTVANQMRLRPGVYTRKKENDELESHFNVKGVALRIFMDPESGIFYMRVGQSKTPLFPVLKAMGVQEGEMRQWWGNDIYAINAKEDDPNAGKKIFGKVSNTRQRIQLAGRSEADALREVFNSMELDPEVTERTLGKRYDRVTPEVMLRASQKLMHISRGEEDTDDRDSLAYQSIHGLEDFFKERIERDSNNLGRRLLWRATFSGSTKSIPNGALTPQLSAVLLTSGLGQPLEEINPLEVYDQLNRVSRMGEGGIPSMDAIPDEARNVQPSYFAYIDPVRAPESAKVGVDARIAFGTMKGSDGQLYSKMFSPKLNRMIHVPARQAVSSVVAFPGEMERAAKSGNDMVRAMVGGKIELVHKDSVDFVVPSGNQIFSAVTGMVPGMSSTKADRASMGSRMSLQALALRNGEAPLVQSAHPEGGSFQSKLGEYMGAIKSKQGGTVKYIRDNFIHVKNDDGTSSKYELYNNFPFNRKSFIHSVPMVKAGQRVEKGQLLARSNFTDSKGEAAIGTNLRVAYMPYEGNTFEDAIVISESAAKKLTSEHMYQSELDLSDMDDVEITKRGYQALFSAKYTKDVFDKYDDNGIIRPGTIVNKDEPLILAIQKTHPRGKGVHTKMRAPYTDAAVMWEHHFPGEITDVFNDGKVVRVAVKAYSPANVGDKLANRYGNKGVISKIVPDDQMIRDKEGNVVDIVMNPFGIISRGNPIQLIETALGKIARKTGKPYILPAFSDEDNLEYALNELKKHGMSDTEDIYDPKANRKIPNVMVGDQYFMKLHHSAESKASGRSIGAYTQDELPARGGRTGSKRVGNLELNALLSHGATAILRDIKTIRGVRNDEFWRAFRLGYPPPTPQVPFVYRKLLAMMEAAGINVEKKGDYTNIMALTDKDVLGLSKGEVKNAETLDFDSMDPIPGGLFDIKLTGGHGGSYWSHYKLSEPLPNPVMEEPIRKLLGLTGAKFEAIMQGKEEINGKTGSAAIFDALKRIDVEKQIAHEKEIIKTGAKSKRDDAVKRLNYLTGSARTGIHPSQWMIQNVPIIPPAFRPISRMGKIQLISDPNHLYKELILSDDNWKEFKRRKLPDGDVRWNTYQAFKAVTGLGDPLHPKLQEKQVKGFLANIFGRGGPKTGFFQHKVLGSAVDVVGRSVITPDPTLNMDQVGLPEEHAWEIYRNFVIRNLISRGSKAVDAVKHVVNKSPTAYDALLEEVKKRPVIITRAPVLHKFGVMAAWPHLTKGDTLRLPPIVCGGFGADFDGDTMNYHIPVSDDAVKEAVEKLMPSKNLLSVSDFDLQYVPPMEYLHGLYMASRGKPSDKPVKYFKTPADVVAAFKRGEINVDDRVKILE